MIKIPSANSLQQFEIPPVVFRTRVAARQNMEPLESRPDYADLRVVPAPDGEGFVIRHKDHVAPGTKKKSAKSPQPALQKRHQEEAEAAAQGKIPKAPDFSADSRARYRPKLKNISDMVKAKDVKALKALAINPVDSANRILLRYRDNAITALEAKS